MEIERNYASKGLAGTALGLGIGGTTLGLLGGTLGNLLGGNMNCGCGGSAPVNRYEMELQQQLAAKDAQIALRDANTYGDQKLLEVYRYFDGKIGCIESKISEQAVYNATNNGAISCIQNQIAQLYGLTKLIVPNSAVCPGWGNVTVTPAAAPTT